MKGLYREEIIEKSLEQYPCGYCEKKESCEKKCKMWQSCHNIYHLIGKTTGKSLLDYLLLCDTKEQAMEAVLKYNQY